MKREKDQNQAARNITVSSTNKKRVKTNRRVGMRQKREKQENKNNERKRSTECKEICEGVCAADAMKK